MLSQKHIDRINKLISDKTFNYNGGLLYDVEKNGDVDFKFQIKGYKKMISVGEWTDYIVVDILITGLNNDISKLIFGFVQTKLDEYNWKEHFKKNLYYFENSIKNYISNVLSYVEGSRPAITIGEIKFSDNIEPLNLSKN
jgi:hypothetical protein